MTIWIATGNRGKVQEFLTLFKKYLLKNHQLKFSKDIEGYVSPEETGVTFEENAFIKAKTLKKLQAKEWVLGEDSGIEVEALNGSPGIYSARYAGVGATEKDNIELLLKNMEQFVGEQRRACFVSCIGVLSPTGKKYVVEKRVKGRVANLVSNLKTGFGYDPVFIPEGESQTVSCLGMEYKNVYSHRALSVKAILEATDFFSE